MALCPMAPVMARISLPAYNAEALVYLSCPVRGGGEGLHFRISISSPTLGLFGFSLLAATHAIFLMMKCNNNEFGSRTKAVQKVEVRVI